MTNDTPLLPLLAAGAENLGFSLTDEQLRRFHLYFDMLVDWNSRINLTAITDPEGVQVRHFLDSLTVGAALLDELARGAKSRPQSPPGGFSLVDIGTGAGFPGVPLKILWPRMHITLADSVGKKVNFLQALVSELGLEHTTLLTARAEELGQDKAHRERYSAATARAVAPLPTLCEYCMPLVKTGGLMLAPKKGDISQEIEGSKRAVKLLGGRDLSLHRFVLSGEDEPRYVVAIKKFSFTPPAYPRRVGLAKLRPLGAAAISTTE